MRKGVVVGIGVWVSTWSYVRLVFGALRQQLPPGLHGLPAVQSNPVGFGKEPEFSPPPRQVPGLVLGHEVQEISVL